MKAYGITLAALLLTSTGSYAAPEPLFMDYSTDILIEQSAAQKMWAENMPLRVWKLYPVRKWGFLSQVEGGFTAANTCLVTARAMLLPRSGKVLLFAPVKSATTFDMQPAASKQQCQVLAQAKLKEAIQALVFNLAPGR